MDFDSSLSDRPQTHKQIQDSHLGDNGVPGWTKARRDRVKELWPDWSISGSKIAAIIGGGLTRNAVIGYANRLIKRGELSPRPGRPPPSPSGRKRKRRRPFDVTSLFAYPLTTKHDEPTEAEFIAADFAVLRIEFADIQETSCRWPLGDTPPYLFCGKPKQGINSYCPHHCGVAFNFVPEAWRGRY